MKLIRHICLLLLLVSALSPSPSMGAEVTQDMAMQVAENWPRYTGLSETDKTATEVFKPYYMYEDIAWVVSFQDDGWAIVANDDNLMPVIAYSPSEKFPEDDNPAIQEIFGRISRELDLIKNLDASRQIEINNSRKAIWSEVLSGSGPKLPPCRLGPLIDSDWYQSGPYNDSCHLDQGNDCNFETRCPTGCVATAMSQIMYYWKYPSRGRDSITYNTDTYNWTVTANHENAIYNWSDMRDTVRTVSPQAQIDAVAELCFHAGASVEMDYCTGFGCSSGADSWDVPNAISHYFRYDNDAVIQNDNANILLEELFFIRPIYVRGTSHAWVCDGYNACDTLILFHWKMGWQFTNDVWATVSDLDDSTGCVYENHIRYIAPERVVRFIGADNPGDGSPNDPYETLDEALINTTNAATFVFKAGSDNTFSATSITINRPLTLKGVNATIRRSW